MDLRQYVKRVLHWWWLLLICSLLAAVVSYYASMQQPRVYLTKTTLLVGQVIQKANPTGQDFATIEQLAASYAQVATRQPVLQAAIDSLGLQMNWQTLKWQVNAATIPLTQLLEIVVKDNSPERAVAIADAIARELILQSPTSPQNQKRAERSAFVQTQLVGLEGRIQRAEARLRDLETQLDTAVSARQIQDIQTEITGLETLINNWQANYADLSAFLEGGDSPNYLTIIEPAQLPVKPISPDVRLNVLIAAVAGMMLALSVAVLVEYIDDSIESADDLINSLNIVSLGSIARIKGKAYKDKMIIAHTPFSPIAEAYRMVRTNIQFTAIDHPAKNILVTSANPEEGKSTTVANLAVIMAQSDLRTIIVDADLRRPSMHKIFQLPNTDGLSDLLRLPGLDIRSRLKNTDFNNLQVITSGSLPPNPSEMLGSQRMLEFMQHLKDFADVVIFDCSPILPVTDAAVLAGRVDGVVLVVQAKRTRRDVIRQAVKRLEQVNAVLLGGVLNQVHGNAGGYYHETYYAHGGDRPIHQSHHSDQHRWWQRWLPFSK